MVGDRTWGWAKGPAGRGTTKAESADTPTRGFASLNPEASRGGAMRRS